MVSQAFVDYLFAAAENLFATEGAIFGADTGLLVKKRMVRTACHATKPNAVPAEMQ